MAATTISSYYEEVALHHAVSSSTVPSYVDYIRNVEENSSSIKYGASLCMQHCFDYHSYYHDHGTTNFSFSAWLAFWCRAIIRKVFLKYLSHPIYLFILPLCVGIGSGWILATLTSKARTTPLPSKDNAKLLIFVKACYQNLTAIISSLIRIASRLPTWIFTITSSRLMKPSLQDKEAQARREASSEEDRNHESRVPAHLLPKHIAVIMDGNRRYGRAKYGIAAKGHWDGSKKLCDFARWCQCEGLQILTVYAFSTENWDRDPAEVETLMEIIVTYCDEILEKAVERQMKVQVLSTETYRIPPKVKEGIKRLVDGTAHCNQFLLNICLSYGSRGEIVNVCKTICQGVQRGEIEVEDLNEDYFSNKISGDCPNPDILIRTSGEMRLSNFQLWQLAYTELFFLKCQWPEVKKAHLIDVIQKYAMGRSRRYGK